MIKTIQNIAWRLPIMNETTRQKINKETEDVNNAETKYT